MMTNNANNNTNANKHGQLSPLLFVVSILFVLTLSSVVAFASPISTQSMTLLAISEGGSSNESIGATASLTLDITSGTGRIFIDTYPFSKVDTQVSVRLANEVACQFLAVDCSKYDFYYSIKTGGSTIGGPSAGAALSALTVASLDGEYINKNATISGTINSGGIVGAVGGLKEKIGAAAKLGISQVLIPLGERYVIDKDNSSIYLRINNDSTNVSDSMYSNQEINSSNNSDNDNSIELPAFIAAPKTDLIAYGKQKGVLVIEVGTLDEVLSFLTNKQYILPVVTVEPPLFYTTQMKKVAQDLCGRAQTLLDNLSVNVTYGKLKIHVNGSTKFPPNQTVILENSNIDLAMTLNSARQLLNTSKVAFSQNAYYSAASYCYGAALNLRFISLLNMTPSQALVFTQSIVNSTNINLSQYRTLTDLQTYMLVDERINEANDRVTEGKKFMDKNASVLAINSFATAIERVSSAKLWSSFFATPGNEISLDLTQVEESCKLKMQEAAERQSLIGYYVEDSSIGSDLLNQAQKQLGKNPMLCLFAASKAKATYDVVLSSLGLTNDVFNATFEKKAQITARVISEQFKRGAFPLIGYSYYEYAQNLADSDQNAALLYMQYALELSNLEAYLPQVSATDAGVVGANDKSNRRFSLTQSDMLVLGIAIGLLLGVTLVKVEQVIRNRKTKAAVSKKKRK